MSKDEPIINLATVFGPIPKAAFPNEHSVTRFDVANALAEAAIAAIGRDAEEGRQAYMEAAENEAKVCPWCQTWLAHECLSGNGCPTPDGKNGDTYHVTMPPTPPAADQSGEVDLTAVYMAGRVDLLKENQRLREALTHAEKAIAEYYRYWTGGETRGSYDGKPERSGLWKAQQAARAALSEGNGDG